jgi:starch synthase
MKKYKVLYVSQEITPYLPESEISKVARYLPQGVQEMGNEIRTFMPKYGNINERRNQLHEVIRLSGMNIIIDETDHPLIIKVASIQAARMQVYFIENEDYFHRKFVLEDEEGKPFEDNDERAIFFARGVLETVKKLRWAPDIVHCLGWFGSLVPLYLKKAYHDDPIFTNVKVIYSVYNDRFSGELRPAFRDKLMLDGVTEKDLEALKDLTWESVMKLALNHSDAVIYGCRDIPEAITGFVGQQGLPALEYQDEEHFIDAYTDFYDSILNGKIHAEV